MLRLLSTLAMVFFVRRRRAANMAVGDSPRATPSASPQLRRRVREAGEEASAVTIAALGGLALLVGAGLAVAGVTIVLLGPRWLGVVAVAGALAAVITGVVLVRRAEREWQRHRWRANLHIAELDDVDRR